MVDDEHSDEEVTPKEKKTRSSSMSNILNEAMVIKKQQNKTKDKELEVRKEEMKQLQAFQHSFFTTTTAVTKATASYEYGHAKCNGRTCHYCIISKLLTLY